LIDGSPAMWIDHNPETIGSIPTSLFFITENAAECRPFAITPVNVCCTQDADEPQNISAPFHGFQLFKNIITILFFSNSPAEQQMVGSISKELNILHSIPYIPTVLIGKCFLFLFRFHKGLAQQEIYYLPNLFYTKSYFIP
jgi:hypothetical protein